MTTLCHLPRCLAPYSRRQVEIVERKGIGYPDTICDALAEELSRQLRQFYLARISHQAAEPADKVLHYLEDLR